MSYDSIPHTPPPYRTRPPSPVPHRRTYDDDCAVYESERSYLIRTGSKSNTRINTTLVLLVVTLFIVPPFIVGLSHLDTSVARERQQWNQELKQRRWEEQQRIKHWEYQLDQRRSEEKRRQEEWENAQRTIRLEEAARREQERLREDKWHKEEEARQRLGLYWGDLTRNDRCTAYNKREYWTPLKNTVPYEYNWQIPCKEIPNVINGRSVNVSWCYTNPHVPGEVIGHWVLDGEPLCAPYWNQFKDKGCTVEGSGLRMIEARLENIVWGEDGSKLCSSTPHDFYGLHFDAPHSCVYWSDYDVYGIWHIDDPNC